MPLAIRFGFAFNSITSAVRRIISSSCWIPSPVFADTGTSIGKYGRMRKSYLKEHRPILYNHLLMSEKLYPHLIEIDRTAQERVDTMLPHMMKTAGVTEELKACDPMRWVGLMNTLTAQIEEILIRELICS